MRLLAVCSSDVWAWCLTPRHVRRQAYPPPRRRVPSVAGCMTCRGGQTWIGVSKHSCRFMLKTKGMKASEVDDLPGVAVRPEWHCGGCRGLVFCWPGWISRRHRESGMKLYRMRRVLKMSPVRRRRKRTGRSDGGPAPRVSMQVAFSRATEELSYRLERASLPPLAPRTKCIYLCACTAGVYVFTCIFPLEPLLAVRDGITRRLPQRPT